MMGNLPIQGYILGVVYVAYATYAILRQMSIVPSFFSITLIRYPYVVLHEVGHTVMGLATGKGIKKLVLKETTTESGGSAGYYLARRQSFLRLGFIRIGDALTALAGPVLPLFYMVFLTHFASVGNTKIMMLMMIAVYGVCVIFSRQRIRFLIATMVTVFGMDYMSQSKEVIGLWIVTILMLWCGLGLIEELIIIGGYNRKGSDMGVFTKSLIGIDWKPLSYVLNKIMQILYLFVLYDIIRILLNV